jgi:isocitrate dehydrogenase
VGKDGNTTVLKASTLKSGEIIDSSVMNLKALKVL